MKAFALFNLFGLLLSFSLRCSDAFLTGPERGLQVRVLASERISASLNDGGGGEMMPDPRRVQLQVRFCGA